MSVVLQKIMAVLGWKRVIRMAWGVAYKELQKRVEDTTDMEWDDEALKVVNELIMTVTA